MIADPICSICIAIFIVISVWGLIKEPVQILMQRQPQELDQQLPEAYAKVHMRIEDASFGLCLNPALPQCSAKMFYPIY